MRTGSRQLYFAIVLALAGLTLAGLTLAGLTGCTGSTSSGMTAGHADEALDYPAARRAEQIDTYDGVEVPDPYRWMEEDSQETAAWVAAQDELLEHYTQGVAGFAALEERLLEIRRFDRFGIPVRRGERYFFTLTEAGEKHGDLYVQDGIDGEPRRIVSFADAIDDPTHSMGGFTVSPDGRHVAWASLSQAGWGWMHVARVADGERPSEPLRERLTGIAGSSAIWTHDNQGFFYTSYGEYEALEDGSAEPRATILYHRLGEEPGEDRLVYSRADRPAMLFRPKLSDDGRYLVVGLNDGSATLNTVIYRDLGQGGESFAPLIDEPDASYVFEGNDGSRLFFRTTLDAPRGRLIAVDLDRPERERWEELIPESEAPLSSVSHIGGRLLVVSTSHARPAVELWTLDGALDSAVELPAIGLISGFGDDPEGDVAFYRMNSLHDPGTVYRLDLRSGRSAVHHRPELAHDPDDYEIKQVFYEGKDGTRIPMFLAHRKGVPLRGDRPLFMYGYGHGGWVAFPWFQPHLIAWMDLGGTYALPGLRGGGEYGREWQDAGTLLNKPTTLDDYVAAAEWLVDRGYTSPTKLVANGGSASGVVPAAAMVRRPDLFAAGVIDFPFLDMLRYHHFTAIKGWTRGYGTSDDPEELQVLLSYSPLHTLRQDECYPAVLTLVGEEDTSTVPMHGYKFTAALQAAQGCPRPSLLKFIPGAGHYSYGTTPEAAAHTEAQILAFLIRSLGLPEAEPGQVAAQRQ